MRLYSCTLQRVPCGHRHSLRGAVRCALRNRARCIVRLDGVLMSADELKLWARHAEELDARLKPARACAHRARERRTSRDSEGRFVERQICRCGAQRTRTLQLDGQFKVTDWAAP